jgi:hypothetical protein
MILSESVDRWGLPISEAISKKLWTTDYRLMDRPEVASAFPELAGYHVSSGECLLIGNVSACRFVASKELEPNILTQYVAGIVWVDGIEAFKTSEKSGTFSYGGPYNIDEKIQKNIYKKIDSFIESKTAGPASTLPEDLLAAVAPAVSSFEVPAEVRDEGERDKLKEKLQSLYSEAKRNFLSLLSPAERSVADAEIDLIRVKKSKDPSLSAFFQKVTPVFAAKLELIKAAVRNRRKEVTDPATGLAIGDKVYFKHPKHGNVEGKVSGFVDGKIQITHKNIERQRSGYASVGNQESLADPADVTLIKTEKSRFRTPPAEIEKTIRDSILNHSDILTVKEDLVSRFAELNEKGIEILRKAAPEAKTKQEVYVIHQGLQRAPRKPGEKMKSLPGIQFIRMMNDDLSVDPQAIMADAKARMEEYISMFVERSTKKISPIIEGHGGLKSVNPISLQTIRGTLEGQMRVEFENSDSFQTLSQLVWKEGRSGPFYQFPTIFRKIKFQGEEISRKEEEWMNTVFAKAGE